MNKLNRKAKINKLENREFRIIVIGDLNAYYQKILKKLDFYFQPVWLSDAVNGPSDDGYWDLRSSIIGFGKTFLINSLNDDQIFIDMVDNHNYAENFGYVFN